jgi:hypothetical protein
MEQPSKKRISRAAASKEEVKQCLPVNLEASFMHLSTCGCCSLAKFNESTKHSDGDNCLHKAFRTKTGFFDTVEAINFDLAINFLTLLASIFDCDEGLCRLRIIFSYWVKLSQ